MNSFRPALLFSLLAFLFVAALPAGDLRAQQAPADSTQSEAAPSAPATPQQPTAITNANSNLLAEQGAVLKDIDAKIASIQRQVEAGITDDAKLLQLRLQLDQLSKDILAAGTVFRPRIAEINARLEQIGTAPAEGAPPEPEAIVAERARLIDEKAQINALLGEAETLSITSTRLAENITTIRRNLFTETLSKRYVLTETLNTSVLADFMTEVETLGRKIASWFRFAIRFKYNAMLGTTFLALLAALGFVYGGRKVLGTIGRNATDVAEPSYLARLLVGFWSTLLPSVGVAIFLGGIYLLYERFSIFTGDIASLAVALFEVFGILFFVQRLAASILRPHAPQWRLLPVRDAAAGTLLKLITATAALTGVDYFMSVVADIESSPLSLTVAKSLIATILVGLVIIAISFVKPFEEEDGSVRPWPRLVRLLIFALGLAPIITALLGYLGLAQFISQQIVLTGAIVVTMYLGFQSAKAIGAEGAFGRTRLGRWAHDNFQLDDTTIDQLGMVSNVGINLLVLFVGIPLILSQWGFRFEEMEAWTVGFLTEIRVGSISISLIGILTGFIVFLIGYFLTRWFQGWLDGNVMARGRMDAGLRNSIRTAIGYAGIALAALIGVSAAGIDLSNLALVAGALSLGIGFGMQNIVSNFVSGLILLAERPFKSGDWIEAGGVQGTVKNIKVRATEIETFQRQTIILPNSELINSAVGNWTHKNKLGRIEVPVGVGYGSDPELVQKLLLEVAHEHPLVLKNPEPFVVFMDFGASSLDFELRAFLSDVGNSLTVKSDLRFAITKAFRAHNIEIPFPQRDINFTTQTAKALADIFGGRETAAPKARPRRKAAETAEAEKPAKGGRRRKRPGYGEVD